MIPIVPRHEYSSYPPVETLPTRQIAAVWTLFSLLSYCCRFVIGFLVKRVGRDSKASCHLSRIRASIGISLSTAVPIDRGNHIEHVMSISGQTPREVLNVGEIAVCCLSQQGDKCFDTQSRCERVRKEYASTMRVQVGPDSFQEGGGQSARQARLKSSPIYLLMKQTALVKYGKLSITRYFLSPPNILDVL